ncbi:hypothetical protein [Demequina sp. NBRC 110055]|uniref:hypothetical protein n=1 Tax=Demequina sp. NBRC 110055 TaxID=1570344 RepID=UPI000A056B0E|nr:hypothetical protein [Demequina sp. NBRC 110055]
MITEWLLQLVGGIAAALVSLLPAVNWDVDDFSGASMQWGTSLSAFNVYVPLTAIFAVAGLLLAVWLTTAAWNGLVWVYHQFWGSN